MSVVDGVERDLEKLGGDLKDSAMAASALALAREMDDPTNSATSKSMCARSLLDVMDRLGQLAPPRKDVDGITDLNSERKRRRAAAGIPAATDLPRT